MPAVSRRPRIAQPPIPAAVAPPDHEHTVLVLQGGGALGAYQAGAFEGFAAAGALPDWVAGVSIGAINGALIAGNPPERRVPRLREFWDRVSAMSPTVDAALLEPARPLFNRLSAVSATMFGIPGFFRLRTPLDSLGALGVYDTEPLRETLLELVDFDLLNSGGVRLSVGAVNVRTGNSVYFDNTQCRLGVEHIMASGALPPGFPPVEIDGELYWDGGIVSNSPLWFVLDEAPAIDALILQVDLFSARGAAPTDLDEVQERSKDIQYSSKTRFNSTQLRQRMQLKSAFRRLLDKLPAKLREDPDVAFLTQASLRTEISLVQLINRHDTRSSSFKDYEFSRATVNELWNAGRDDVRRTVSHPEWCRATQHHEGLREFDLTR